MFLGFLGFLGFNVYAQSHAVHWTQEYDQEEGLHHQSYITISISPGSSLFRDGVRNLENNPQSIVVEHAEAMIKKRNNFRNVHKVRPHLTSAMTTPRHRYIQL